MKKIIIIKYGELTTKKDNINFFITTLKDNIKNCLVDYETEIKYDKGRMFIYANEDNLDVVIEKIKKTFGIHEINIGYEIDDNSIENIKKSLIELIKDRDITSFKIVTKRSDKKYPINSMEISRQMGGIVLKNKEKAEVDVHNPKMIINIEVRLNNKVYIYFDKIKGIGGYPVGVAGKGLLMLSGGIDSPVAGYLALKRGVRIEAVYFESPPHTSDAAKNKVISLAKKLSEYSGYVKLHVINFTAIQEAILKNCPHEYLVTIMRRMMYRISERIAKKNNCKVLINGESIGQVASQTLTSMAAINCVTKLPVIRPVACLDKLDIIEIAKNIDTYETSILPFEDCCTIFVAKHPVTKPNLNIIRRHETNLDEGIDALVKTALETDEVIEVV